MFGETATETTAPQDDEPTASAAPPAPAWMHRLNPAQRAAVTHDGPSLLVVPGAGTGKTGTLAARVAHLIESGTAPDRILLLTFTRRAAQEMLTRAGQLTDESATDRVWGGTFHSVANRLLRIEGRSIGLHEGFTVLDQGDAVDLMGIVRAEHVDTGGSRFPKKETVAAIYDRVVGTQRPLAEVVRAEFPWCGDHLEAIPHVFDGYTRRKRARRLLDYADLLLFWRAMLASPEVGDQVARRFDHVLVDEFQDTDPVQADIVHAIADRGARITVVGDDAQAIYGFRAATVENMWGFAGRREGTERVTLEENYRSVPPILDVANDVLAASDVHFEKRLRAHRAGQRRPTLVTCRDEMSQARTVVDRILDLREEGLSLVDQVVLFRTGHHSDLVELELGRRNVPYVKYGGLKFLEAAHVKDLVALLRLLDNPYDELAWNRMLRVLPGVGPATVSRALATLGITESPDAVPSEDGADPLARFLAERPPLPSAAHDDAAALVVALGDCLGGPDHEPSPAEQVERLAGWLEPTFERRYDRSEVRVADLVQLQVTAQAYTSRSRFLAELVLEPPASTGDLADEPHLDDDYLTLSTVHSAKGGEWSAVHVIHATDGNFPADMSLTTPGGLEEERRLMYVALTRAKDVLTLYAPLRYHHTRARSDRHSYAPVSRFVSPLRHHFAESTDGADPADPDSMIDLGTKVSVADEVDLSTQALWTL
jgi:DNA helicase-2/ATP-dependent DNA helicase PcrA